MMLVLFRQKGNIMMNLVTVILGFLFGSKTSKNWNFTEIAMNIFDEAIHRSRKPVALLLAGFASVILFCAGLIICLLDVTRQFDLSGHFYPGAVFWSGLVMAGIFLMSMVYGFSKAWPKHFLNDYEMPQMTEELHHPTMQEALSLLILDHIEERKMKRAQSSRFTSENFQEKHSDVKDFS